MGLLSTGEVKALAKQLAELLKQPAPAEKGATGVQVTTSGGVVDFPQRPSPQTQERDIS